MFNTNISDLSSINCGSLELFESVVDFDDLAFLQMVMCMQESDQALSAKMKEIRNINRQKQRITRDIDALNEALTASGATEDDHPVWLNGTLEDPGGRRKQTAGSDNTFTIPDGVGDVVGSQAEAAIMRGYQTGKFKDPSRIAGMNAGAPVGNEVLDEFRGDKLTKAEVDDRIEVLRGELESLNTSSSVMMIDLQRLLNKRSEAVQLVSNIESRSHKTAMAIVANFS